MECFRADFLEFFTKNYKICLFDWRLGTRQQIPEFQKFSWNFVISCEMLKRLVLAVFFQETSKFGYLADGCEVAIKSKHFRNFLETSYFRVEWFRADSWNSLTRNVWLWLLGGGLRTCHEIQQFQEFSWSFLIACGSF